MSATQRSADRFADLTDRELEVLRLLASGHTVKTIAAQLGCSEASINKRLRDARRKTGIGSSRELARLLAAEHLWGQKSGTRISIFRPNTPATTVPHSPTSQGCRNR